MYWVRDLPSRLAGDAKAEAVVLQSTAERIAERWRLMDAQLPRNAPYLLGDRIGMLDRGFALRNRASERGRSP